MTKIRSLVLFLTILVVGVVGTLAFYYARGYRFNSETLSLSPNGIFVIKSVPDGAQVIINGELKTATNATFPMPPGVYDVTVRKEGFLEWKKRLTVSEEIVTETTAHLFKAAPSLSSITFSGSLNPVPSPDSSKISYSVPADAGNGAQSGLWVIEAVNLPLGFVRDPRRITDGDLTDASWIWSPNARQILLTTPLGVYLLDTGNFTAQAQRINVAQTKDTILQEWEEEKEKRISSQLRRVPEELRDILQRRAESLSFSPDEDMVLYTASGSATIPPDLIKPVPGASSQRQERNIKDGQTYIYDIKEDRNFLISEEETHLTGWVEYEELINIENSKQSLAWYPSSRNLILAEDGKITIMDHDGTNRQVVYSGSYVAPHVYPTLSLDRLLILTNLGSESGLPNLYSLSLK